MADVLATLLVGSAVLFFGFLAEFLFKKFHVPDVFVLIVFGFLLGPYIFGYIDPASLSGIAPVFTAFALLFLLFDGAFNIDLRSLFRGLGKGMLIIIYNFFISSIAIAFIALLFKFDFAHSMLLGFILGGISSAFVIPIIQNLKIKKETYSILTLESAVTDVLCIVFAITMMQIITLNSFSLNKVAANLISLFVIAGFFGLVAGFGWILLIGRIFQKNKPYMLMIAYLLLLYSVTEYLNGNGAIATLFFGLVLKNSKKLRSFMGGEIAISAITPTEKLFYSQISFFLKTFFFVYIGVLLDFSNTQALIIGALISIAVLLLRNTTSFLTKELTPYDRDIINSMFARGLAAAVLAQLAIQSNIEDSLLIAKITFAVIMFTIILSSARIFWAKSGASKMFLKQ